MSAATVSAVRRALDPDEQPRLVTSSQSKRHAAQRRYIASRSHASMDDGDDSPAPTLSERGIDASSSEMRDKVGPLSPSVPRRNRGTAPMNVELPSSGDDEDSKQAPSPYGTPHTAPGALGTGMSASSPTIIGRHSRAHSALNRVRKTESASTPRQMMNSAFQRGSSLFNSTRDLMTAGGRAISRRLPRRKPKVKRPQIKTATEIMNENRKRLNLGADYTDINESKSWRAVKRKPAAPQRRPCCVLRPQSPIRLGWDLVTLFLLLYIAIATPFQIGFSVDATGFVFYLEKLVDVFFITDLMLNFRTGYVSANGEEVLRPCQIAKHYLCGWFWIDLMSSIPFDFIFAGLNDLRSAKMLKAGRVVKALRVVRLTKLVRFLKLAVFIEKLEENFSINRNLLQLVKLLLGTVVMCHFFACMWYFFGSLDDAPGGWVYEEGVQNAPTSTQYLVSFYWAVATLATVGYGDVVPISDSERTFAIIGMLLGGGYFGYIIATMASLVSKLDASTAAYHNKMDAIVSYMKSRNLPKELQMRIRKYYKHYLEKKTAFDESAMLSELSTFLRQEVAMFLINDTLLKIPIFRNRDPIFVADLITVLKPLTCSDGDFIMREGEFGREMYVLIRGELEVMHEGHALAVLGPGSYFGEMAVLYDDRLRRQATIRAATYCEMYSLTRDDLRYICRDHPAVIRDMQRIADQTSKELQRQRAEFVLNPETAVSIDASLLLHRTAGDGSSDSSGSDAEVIDEKDLVHGKAMYELPTKREGSSSSLVKADRPLVPGRVGSPRHSAPPVNFVLSPDKRSNASGRQHSDSKEHPSLGTSFATSQQQQESDTSVPPPRRRRRSSPARSSNHNVQESMGGLRAMLSNQSLTADSQPHVRKFAQTAFNLRRMLGRLEGLVDTYTAVPVKHRSASRPGSSGPGLLLLNNVSTMLSEREDLLQAIVTTPHAADRRNRSQSVVATSSPVVAQFAASQAAAWRDSGTEPPANGSGRGRPPLMLSSSAGTLKASQASERRRGTRQHAASERRPRPPPLIARVEDTVLSPPLTPMDDGSGAGGFNAPPDSAVSSRAVRPQVSSRDIQRMRRSLQECHEQLKREVAALGDVLERL